MVNKVDTFTNKDEAQKYIDEEIAAIDKKLDELKEIANAFQLTFYIADSQYIPEAIEDSGDEEDDEDEEYDCDSIEYYQQEGWGGSWVNSSSLC